MAKYIFKIRGSEKSESNAWLGDQPGRRWKPWRTKKMFNSFSRALNCMHNSIADNNELDFSIWYRGKRIARRGYGSGVIIEKGAVTEALTAKGKDTNRG